jgi:hypothetical protein
MTGEADRRRATLADDGHGVAADVEPLDDRDVVRASLHADAGPRRRAPGPGWSTRCLTSRRPGSGASWRRRSRSATPKR